MTSNGTARWGARGSRYTDFFVLLKRGEDWKIASKAFLAHSRA
ncbi:nuclear transport factor 2 family protein [Acidisphaera sp. S103]